MKKWSIHRSFEAFEDDTPPKLNTAHRFSNVPDSLDASQPPSVQQRSSELAN